MAKSKRNFYMKTTVLSALLLFYFISVLVKADSFSLFLSPLNALACAGLLYFAYIKVDRTSKVRFTLLLYAIGCFSWGIGDIIWGAISFSGGESNMPVTQLLYVLTNCCFLASLVIFAVQQFKKWDFVQYSIDIITCSFMTIALFWIIFLNKDIEVLYQLIRSDFTSVFSIITDTLICISISSWFLSVRSGKTPSFLRIISAGLLLFALVDIMYYYLDYNGLYIADSINDFLYILSFTAIAFGALWKVYKNISFFSLSVVMNTGGRRRWVYLLLFPLVAILFSFSGIMENRLSFTDIQLFAVPILLYFAFCGYVQLSLEKEALLKHDNEILERRVAEQVKELTYLANQDTLTTLYNRRYFIACLEDTIKNKLDSEKLALFFLDLDRFKTINDTYGHNIGDSVLIEIANRLIKWNNYGATIARLGGDEFAVLFIGKYTQRDYEDLCTEILNLSADPMVLDEYTLRLSMSIGIAFEEETCDVKTLMQNADIAMYKSKSLGYNKYQVYNKFMSQDVKKASEIELLLGQIDAERDFELFYQPQFSLPDRELIGAEALIQWISPEFGFIPPNIFIPIAEQLECIFSIGKWVLRETVKQSSEWNNKYKIPLKVGFNVSPKQFNDESFISLIKVLIDEKTIDPSWIDAEITEGTMLDECKNIDYSFSVLRDLGVSVSVDDFGSGYSALGYLNKYPFDRIKIDKSLIDNLSLHNNSGVSIVRAAINMAHASGIKVIAEGVESQEQLDILIGLGCDQVQGYLLGRPVTVTAFEQRYIEPYLQKN